MLNGSGTERNTMAYVTHADIAPLIEKTDANAVNNAILTTEFKNMHANFTKMEECMLRIDSKTSRLLGQEDVQGKIRGWALRGGLITGGWIIGVIAEHFGQVVKWLNHLVN